MYLGKIVEIGTEDEIYERPTHPYTQALLSAVPVPDPTQRDNEGDHPAHRRRAEPGRSALGLPVPDPLLEGAGHLRRARSPLLEIGAAADHPSACHFAEEREIVVTHEAGAVCATGPRLSIDGRGRALRAIYRAGMHIQPDRAAFDIEQYERRVREGPCFIRAFVAGDPDHRHHVVDEDERLPEPVSDPAVD